jgi:hypothetical protein
MLRYLDTFARYIWLWLIPLILLPVGVSFLIVSNSTYTATGSLWVEQSLFSDTPTNNAQGPSWQSPAQQMAGLLSELMNTREFVNGVIDNTSTRNSLKSEADRIKAIGMINDKTIINGDKFRLITVSYTGDASTAVVETVAAIMTQFQNYYNTQLNQQGEAAVAYYQKLAASSKADLDKATATVQAFIEQHPNQLGRSTTGEATTALDLEFSNLNKDLTDARARYDDSNNNLQKVASTYNAYKQGQSITLRVQDKPAIIGNAAGLLRPIALGAGIGLALGLFLALLGTILLTWLDETIRYGFYARQVLGRGNLLVLPEYKVLKPARLKAGQTSEGQPVVVIKEGAASKRRRKAVSHQSLLKGLINQIKIKVDNSSSSV